MPFLLFIFFILVPPALATQEANPTLTHDGFLRIFNYHRGEFLDIRYLDDDQQWLVDASQKISHFLRSRDNQEYPIDKRLIELIDHLQDHFEVDTIEIISAYRSDDLNRALKEEGRHVAENSFHTRGMALDIHIDEICEDELRDYLLSLQQGGVGYYGSLHMVHLDLGPVRRWSDGVLRQNTSMGVFNDQTGATLKTDRLISEQNSRLILTLTGLSSGTLVLQKFYRGQWQDVGEVLTEGRSVLEIALQHLSKSPSYGKFRFRYEHADDWQNSNEFYIKRMLENTYDSHAWQNRDGAPLRIHHGIYLDGASQLQAIGPPSI